jgi:hypothetical protein
MGLLYKYDMIWMNCCDEIVGIPLLGWEFGGLFDGFVVYRSTMVCGWPVMRICASMMGFLPLNMFDSRESFCLGLV